jgi:hypothetical protein
VNLIIFHRSYSLPFSCIQRSERSSDERSERSTYMNLKCIRSLAAAVCALDAFAPLEHGHLLDKLEMQLLRR